MKHILIAASAIALMGGTGAIAQTANTGAAGVAGADRNGAVAGGVSMGQSQAAQHRNRGHRRGQAQTTAPSSVSTNTNGAVYTTRRSGSAAISTQGSATGPGSVSSSSEGDVYSSTTRQGSDADAYGNSTATAREPRPARPPR